MKTSCYVVLFLSAMFWGGCSDNSIEPQDYVSKKGSIQFNIDKANVPEDVVYVNAYLSRPNFDTLKTTMNIDSDSSANISFNGIAIGIWHLRVDALNASNKVLFTGQGDVEIKENAIVQAYLELDPISSGMGVITINITWENYKTLILQPGPANGKDVFINFPQTTTNYSMQNYLLLHSGEPLVNGQRQIHRVIMDFDLSSIPKNSLIVKAELSLFWGGRVYNAPAWIKYNRGANAFVIKRAAAPWNPASVNWSNQPAFSNDDSVYVPASPDSMASYQNINMKNLVQRYVSNPENSTGFIFKLADENANAIVSFRSSNDTDIYLRPTLTVKYR